MANERANKNSILEGELEKLDGQIKDYTELAKELSKKKQDLLVKLNSLLVNP